MISKPATRLDSPPSSLSRGQSVGGGMLPCSSLEQVWNPFDESFLCSQLQRMSRSVQGSGRDPTTTRINPSDRFRSHSSINVIMRISVLLGFVPGHFEVFVRLVSSDLSDISISICQVRSARVVSQSMGVALSQSDSCDYL